ncbi:MAG: (d)CMP kinase [Eubacterium ventriosum]
MMILKRISSTEITRDMHREISPLVQAEDAVLVDSSNMTIEQVVETIAKLVK